MAEARPHDPELDRLTLERARRGDRAAQAAFLRRYVRPLHALLSRSGLRGDGTGRDGTGRVGSGLGRDGTGWSLGA